MVIERTNETETPNPRCNPEQFKHKKIPLLTDAHNGLDVPILTNIDTTFETILIICLS